MQDLLAGEVVWVGGRPCILNLVSCISIRVEKKPRILIQFRPYARIEL
jgi:hypothetical protein